MELIFYFVIFGVSSLFDDKTQKYLNEKFNDEKRDSIVQVIHRDYLHIVSFEHMRVYPTEDGELIEGYDDEDYLHYSLGYYPLSLG